MTDKKKVLALLVPGVIFIIAFILRLLYIDTAFWYDEACSWVSASQSFPFGIINNLLTIDLQHTPLYFFLLHFWMRIFGDGEVAIRMLSLLFGSGSVVLAYIVSNKLFNNNRIISYSAMLLAAVSPLLVFFSVEARMYPAAVFLVLLSLNFLIDYEKAQDLKSPAKLILVNILIPYTLVGGILYNIALAFCYCVYLYSERKDKFLFYIKGLGIELFCLIPYFVMVGYYAKMRSLFVIRHEGEFAFWQFVEVLRNFFAPNIVPNPYWPTLSSYDMSVSLIILVVVPCCYFLTGLFKGFKKSSGFLKVIYLIFFLSLCFSLVGSIWEINVFTMRYILYLLIPMLILALYGLFTNLSLRHFVCFISLFAVAATVFDFQYAKSSKILKYNAMASVYDEAYNLGLGADDVVILPFGADAPYYFRLKGAPRVYNFDFHKEVRNPYNNSYYSLEQQKLMDKEAKYGIIYDSVFADSCFSDNFVEHFSSNVVHSNPEPKYVLLGLFGSDANSLVPISVLRESVHSLTDVKNNTVDIMLKKYINDVGFLLEKDFNLIKKYHKDDYLYLLYERK